MKKVSLTLRVNGEEHEVSFLPHNLAKSVTVE